MVVGGLGVDWRATLMGNQWDLLVAGGLEGQACGSDRKSVGPSDGEWPQGRAHDSGETFQRQTTSEGELVTTTGPSGGGRPRGTST
jgi:hypothetical protein